jgi:hypothetical protein
MGSAKPANRQSRARGQADTDRLRRIFTVTYGAMLGKILLTLAVVLGALYVIRTRMRDDRPAPETRSRARPPLIPPQTTRAVAYGLVALMLGGSVFWLYLEWEARREVVAVQVINANTGEMTTYRARRIDVEGRHFTTLDGRRVTLADVERMVLDQEAR